MFCLLGYFKKTQANAMLSEPAVDYKSQMFRFCKSEITEIYRVYFLKATT